MEDNNINKKINIIDIKNKIPKKCFEIDTIKSFLYLFKDIIIISLIYYIKDYMFNNVLSYIIWANLLGLMMWSIFVIGHDCGHGTFSRNKIINDIIGHFCHGVLLVPYWPWKKSHYNHHLNHNHIDKDNSHSWVLYEKESILNKIIHNIPFLIPILFPFYLIFGIIDGSHIWPGSILFKNNKDRIKCVFSTFVCFLNLVFIHNKYSLKDSFYNYYFPYFIFSTWLYMVTYLQHHEENTIVYTNDDWSFIKGAFETIDRTFGYGIDDITHNITNGHVVHHLFFNKIPHYHLTKATNTVKNIKGLNYKHTEIKLVDIIKSHIYKYRLKLIKKENIDKYTLHASI